MRTRSAIEDVAGTSSASVLTPPTATPRAHNEPAMAGGSQGPPPPTRAGGTRKCEDCQNKSSSFGLPDEQIRRWCGDCARSHPGSLSSKMFPKTLARAGCPSKEARRPAAGMALENSNLVTEMSAHQQQQSIAAAATKNIQVHSLFMVDNDS